MFKLTVLPAARDDLFAIGDYIAADNPARAASFVVEIERRIWACAERPLSFPARDHIAPGLRSAKHGRYLIFFTFDGIEVQIVRVLHGMRNLDHLLNT